MKSMKQMSKLIALVLRHKPEALGLTMDAHGWVRAEELIAKLNEIQPFTRDTLEQIVREDSKQRYAFSEDGTCIRANQGHSVPADLGFTPRKPPEYLWHGTGEKSLKWIQQEGLKPMSRQYVHLSADHDTAVKVGKRHGKPVLFVVDAGRMHRDGLVFYQSENGVWLTDAVPPEYLRMEASGNPVTG